MPPLHHSFSSSFFGGTYVMKPLTPGIGGRMYTHHLANFGFFAIFLSSFDDMF
jgi:hypothetical protein